MPLARLRTMDELMAQASGDSRFRTFVLAGFGILGLVLALVGVYGVMAYTVSQRLHELGIRAALGARQSDLLSLVLKDAGLLTAAGVAIGLAWTRNEALVANVEATTQAIHAAALGAIIREGDGAAIFNPLNWQREDPVVLDLAPGTRLSDFVCQNTPDGRVLAQSRQHAILMLL